ncbi:MAG TPA: ABC transporter substrate-binding protein [Anaerolineales bacterium]|nr:ABC transporter substrate-binding protein [Anaerolineales bacterium]
MSQFIKIFILFVFILSGCTSSNLNATNQATQASLTKIRLPMGYIPNVQYAPFYVAAEKGFFQQAGLEVEFDYSFETDGVALVGADALQFSLVSGEQVLLARSQELPVVYVMSWWYDYPVGVVSLKDKNILAPQDLAGHSIGLPGLFGASYIGLRALLNAGGLEESDVSLQSIGFNQVEALVAGQVDSVVIYANNEPYQLEKLGYEVDLIRVADYVKLTSNGLMTNEKTILESPELVQRMINATLKGVAYTLENPEEAFEICKKFIEDFDPEQEQVQTQILLASMEYWKSDTPGFSDPVAWENMQEVLLNMALLETPIDLEKAFTNQFVK